MPADFLTPLSHRRFVSPSSSDHGFDTQTGNLWPAQARYPGNSYSAYKGGLDRQTGHLWSTQDDYVNDPYPAYQDEVDRQTGNIMPSLVDYAGGPSSEYEEEWAEIEECTRLAQERSWASKPMDDWSSQHAPLYPVGPPASDDSLCTDTWKDQSSFLPLHDELPWYDAELDGLRDQIRAEEEMWEERRRQHSAKYGDSVYDLHRGSPQEQEIDEARRTFAELVARQERNELAELQRSQADGPQRSEPSEPSLQSVVEALTAHQATKKKQKRKQPLVLKPKYVSLHGLLSHY